VRAGSLWKGRGKEDREIREGLDLEVGREDNSRDFCRGEDMVS
jgi:hypothetical protein